MVGVVLGTVVHQLAGTAAAHIGQETPEGQRIVVGVVVGVVKPRWGH